MDMASEIVAEQEVLAEKIRAKIIGRGIHGISVEIIIGTNPPNVVLMGTVHSFYKKSLAQEAVFDAVEEERNLRIDLTNNIEVDQLA